MRHVTLLVILVLFAACGPTPAPEALEPVRDSTADRAGDVMDGFPDSTATLLRVVGPYRVLEVGPIWPGHNRLVVERDGRRVWSRLGHFVGLGQGGSIGTYHASVGPDAPPSDTSAVRDLTGDGVPELLTWHSTLGGGLCCTIIDVLTLGGSVRTLFSLDVGRSDDSGFRDLDGDGVDEFVHRDLLTDPPTDVVSVWDGRTWTPRDPIASP